MWCLLLAAFTSSASALSALKGRAAVVHFHDALLAGLDARDALARLELMETGVGATPDVVTYSLVAAACLDENRAAEADDVLARGAAFSKKRAAYRKPTKRGVVAAAAASLGQPLHEDEQTIAVAKPNGVLSMTEGTTKGVATLPDAIEHAYGVTLSDLGGPLARGVVHRLDRDVSGCMVLAKTRRAHALLIREFAARRVEKTYLAVEYQTKRAAIAYYPDDYSMDLYGSNGYFSYDRKNSNSKHRYFYWSYATDDQEDAVYYEGVPEGDHWKLWRANEDTGGYYNVYKECDDVSTCWLKYICIQDGTDDTAWGDC